MLEIQDGSQIARSTNISEHIPSTFQRQNLRLSTMANSQEVYQGVFNYDRQLKMAAETGSTYISETKTGTVKILTTNLRFKTL